MLGAPYSLGPSDALYVELLALKFLDERPLQAVRCTYEHHRELSVERARQRLYDQVAPDDVRFLRDQNIQAEAEGRLEDCVDPE